MDSHLTWGKISNPTNTFRLKFNLHLNIGQAGVWRSESKKKRHMTHSLLWIDLGEWAIASHGRVLVPSRELHLVHQLFCQSYWGIYILLVYIKWHKKVQWKNLITYTRQVVVNECGIEEEYKYLERSLYDACSDMTMFQNIE